MSKADPLHLWLQMWLQLLVRVRLHTPVLAVEVEEEVRVQEM
jgi:hypothetical protein